MQSRSVFLSCSRVQRPCSRVIINTDDVYNGDLWLMSTLNGKRFYEEWVHGGNEWERISVPATEC